MLTFESACIKGEHYTRVLLDGKEVDRVSPCVADVYEYARCVGVLPNLDIIRAVAAETNYFPQLLPDNVTHVTVAKGILSDDIETFFMRINGPQRIHVKAPSHDPNSYGVMKVSGYLPHMLKNIKRGRLMPYLDEGYLSYSIRLDVMALTLPFEIYQYIIHASKKRRRDMLKDFLRLLFRV
mgnify:CR=1 FL=1